MKKRQLAKLGLTLGLVAAVGVGGTMALLTAETDEVTNTFTVGDGLTAADLELDETNIKNPEGARVKENTYENLTPAMSFVKDPQVRISAKAADCYAFIRVVGVDDLLEEVADGKVTGWNQSWKLLAKESDEATYDGIYYWQTNAEAETGLKVSQGTEEFAEYVFTGIELGKDAELYKEDGSKKETLPQIYVDACAVQAAGKNDATAWENALKELPTDFVVFQ